MDFWSYSVYFLRKFCSYFGWHGYSFWVDFWLKVIILFVFRLKLFILGWRFCKSFGCWFGFLKKKIYIRCLFDMWIKFFCSDTSSVVSLKFIGCFGRLSLDTLSWGGPTGWSSSRCESLKVQIGWLFFLFEVFQLVLVIFGFGFGFRKPWLNSFQSGYFWLILEFLVNKWSF